MMNSKATFMVCILKNTKRVERLALKLQEKC